MFPTGLQLQTIFGSIANRAGNRSQPPLLNLDIHLELARLSVSRLADRARRYGNRRHNPCGQQSASQICFETALIDVAGLEPRDS